MVRLTEIEAMDAESGTHNIIIETPRGSRNKLKYHEKSGIFTLHKVLPVGAVFPYDFGFIPSTMAQDGDPLDALVLMDEPVNPGVLVSARLIGAIEAEQTEDGKTVRNDRLIAVESRCKDYLNIKELTDLNENLVAQIEHFFISYNQIEGKQFKPIARPNAARARQLVTAAEKRFRRESEKD